MITVMICEGDERVIFKDLEGMNVIVIKYLKLQSYYLITVNCPDYLILTFKNYVWCKSICE